MSLWRGSALVAVVVFAASAVRPRPAVPPEQWAATWIASPEACGSRGCGRLQQVDNQTVRERVRASIGGPRLRVRLSNEYGSSRLVIGAATVALTAEAGSIVPSSIHALTFGGHASVTVPAGAPILSDDVTLAISAGADLSISIFFPERVLTPTIHALALKRTFLSGEGDHSRDEKIAGGATSSSSMAITGVLVPRLQSQRVVVAYGDSITDGDASTIDQDRTWVGDLARRATSSSSTGDLAIVNAGIAGNRLLGDGPSATFGANGLARFDRDALGVPGVTHVILLEGLNDIAFPGARAGGLELASPADQPGPDDVIDAYRQIIARAHTRGVKVIGATLTPFEGATIEGYYSDAKEGARQNVNAWIRSSALFDRVIDFDAIVRDPDRPAQLRSPFASTDRLHPNDTGYQRMADAIGLELFR